MKYIVDIKGEIEGDYEIIGKYEERPKGEWIIDGHHRRCTHCNEYTCTEDREGNSIPDNFCPNCGEKMKGGAE